MEQQEKNGEAVVIRAQRKSDVGGVEKEKEELRLLYEEGYREAEQSYERLMAYLES